MMLKRVLLLSSMAIAQALRKTPSSDFFETKPIGTK